MAIQFSDIANLVWDHPLASCMLLLLLTPPLFPVLVFFSPLLFSTALCVLALISVGPHITATGEEVERQSKRGRLDSVDANSRSVISKDRTAKTPKASNEDMTWLDWMKGLDSSGRAWVEKRLKEEGLLTNPPSKETILALIEAEKLHNARAPATNTFDLHSESHNGIDDDKCQEIEDAVEVSSLVLSASEDEAVDDIQNATVKSGEEDVIAKVEESDQVKNFPRFDSSPEKKPPVPPIISAFTLNPDQDGTLRNTREESSMAMLQPIPEVEEVLGEESAAPAIQGLEGSDAMSISPHSETMGDIQLNMEATQMESNNPFSDCPELKAKKGPVRFNVHWAEATADNS